MVVSDTALVMQNIQNHKNADKQDCLENSATSTVHEYCNPYTKL